MHPKLISYGIYIKRKKDNDTNFNISVSMIFFPLATLAEPLNGNVSDSQYSGVCKYYPAPMSIQAEHEYFSGTTTAGASVVVDWSRSVVTEMTPKIRTRY
jgi:hypothetical protein